MATVRCAGCRCFVDKDSCTRLGIGYVCGDSCTELYRQRIREERRRKQDKKIKPGKSGAAAVVRRRVRRRDGHRCRWCGASWTPLQVHHVAYRSEGGQDTAHNLVSLCDSCHRRAHSDKRRWQPILLALLWRQYADGVFLTVPQAERQLLADGMLDRPDTGDETGVSA